MYMINIRFSSFQEFVDVIISKGSIVIIPYLLAEDGPDQDYSDEIAANLFKIFSTVSKLLLFYLL